MVTAETPVVGTNGRRQIARTKTTSPRVAVVGHYPAFGSLMESLLAERSYIVTGLDPALATIPFLVVTGDPEVVPAGISPDAVIVWPFTLPELLERIEAMLPRPPVRPATATGQNGARPSRLLR